MKTLLHTLIGQSLKSLQPDNIMQNIKSVYSFYRNQSKSIDKSNRSSGRDDPSQQERTNQSPQVYVEQAVKSAVQNRNIEMEPQAQSKTFIRHKPLYAKKNGPLCKTRKREGAIETALRFCEKRQNLRNRPGKSHPKSESFYSTQSLICHEERSAVQNKKTNGGTIMSRSL